MRRAAGKCIYIYIHSTLLYSTGLHTRFRFLEAGCCGGEGGEGGREGRPGG